MLPPIITTARYILKPYTVNDLSRFLEISLDKEVSQFMGGTADNAEEETKLFYKIFDIYSKDTERWFWIWGVYSDNKLCAHMELKQTDTTNSDELEIVYMVHPEERRKGLMSEVLSVIKQNQHKWDKRITATVYPENKKSIALLEKWGIEKTETRINESNNRPYLKLLLTV
ncbi:GNAT family N-acetyltransferase [Chitinophaga niabensis]|uniref:Protein N-acetyltransferase, RimJ/RimL family n=1 Tax=Chitinophaga niabensis TaxID=536979 RepID=A0A1N6FXI4_9BACT|nr:GNAT family protein [Chitinophaga niabensis]SIO00066.1 Protein N-acetyltransferase, RimJ/RimL family [Chitinophaga niabensis]